ncbi:MAG: permease [Candidatus Abawacabacteria bacterium]|nr:permease [Candidatus Abawacabacteria bacterium]
MFSLPSQLNDFFIIFLGLVIEALPFILLGVILSSLLSLFITEEKVLRFIPRNKFLALLYASLTGFLLPVCECGNIPLARKFTMKGIPPYLAVTFLLAAPVLNPIVVFSTYAAFRDIPEIVILRFVFAFIVAIIVGYIFSFAKDKREIVKETSIVDCHVEHAHTHSRWSTFMQNMQSEFAEMMVLMVIGGLIAAAVQTFLPRQLITSLGTGPVISIVVMMLLAFVVSICSNVDAFFALAYASTFSSGAILAFLVFGPMIDIKSLIMMSTTFKTKAIVLMTILTLQLVFVLTLLMNLYVS